MQNLFFILMLLCSTLSFKLHANNEKQLKQAELQQLNKKITTLKSNLRKTQKKHNQQTSELAKIESSIGTNEKNIKTIKLKLINLDKEKSTLLAQKQELLSNQTILKKQMESLFLNLYRQGNQTWLKTLLSETNPANFSRKLKYVEFITQSQRLTLQSFFDNQNKLETTIADIENKTKSTQDEQLNLSKAQQSLLSNKRQRANEINKLSQSISSSKQQIEISEKNKAQLETLIKNMLITLSNQDLGLEDIKFNKLKGKLRWPIKSRASNRFGSRTSSGRTWNGWEMPTATGTEVKVIASGRVIFSDWLRGFGLLMIVDHGDGYLSLYGRNQSLLKEEGQWVSANEAISIVGLSGGYDKTALYFEIRQNSKPQNPASWLSKTIR